MVDVSDKDGPARPARSPPRGAVAARVGDPRPRALTPAAACVRGRRGVVRRIRRRRVRRRRLAIRGDPVRERGFVRQLRWIVGAGAAMLVALWVLYWAGAIY